MNTKIDMQRRQFLAKKGDDYALGASAETKEGGPAQQFGRQLAAAGVEKASVRGLEALAWSTDSIADILDYIHLRTGRQHGWGTDQLGINLVKTLEKLRSDADLFVARHQIAEADAGRQLHLDLCREFIKHLTAFYEFHKSKVVFNERK